MNEAGTESRLLRTRDCPIRILVVDDSAADAELMIAIIRRSGMSVTFDHVDSPEAYKRHLASNVYDVVLSDHNLKSWVALDALEILRQSFQDMPFIVVTGTLGDERAVEYLKEGASDYVLKDQLEKLPSAIDRVLREKGQQHENLRLQKMIRESKEDWERTFNAIPDSIMLLDSECRIVRANRATAEILGLDSAQIVGKHCFSLLHQSSCPPLECPFRRMLVSGKQEETEITETKLDKILRIFSIPLSDERGNPQGAIHIMRDITDSKHLEHELFQSQKLEAIGRLAGGVAHDFNNILGVIIGYSELIQGRISESDSVLREQIGEIRKAADRATGVTRQLLAFSRKQLMQLKTIGLNEVVNDVARMLRTLIGENIDLVIQMADDLGIVKVDPVQIQQVLINLAINARDAMPNGGELSIVGGNVELDLQYPRMRRPVTPGKYVMLAVSDTGIGMDEETVAHIFEPFFTTKEKGKGTGFGLSIVYGIVKQSGGYIWAYSEPHHGTTFKIYLPRIAEVPSNVVPIATQATAKPASGTILVVEDEEALARVVSAVLEASGYIVLHADTGEAAVTIARNYDGKIDLLLSDVVLRGTMDGLQVARKLSTLRPDAKLLFISGYSDALNRCGSSTNAPLLEKPFTNAELRRKVREVLDAIPESHGPIAAVQGLPLPRSTR